MAIGTVTLIAFAIGASASEPTFLEEVSMVGDAAYPTGGTAGLQAAYRAKGAAQADRTIVTVLPVDCKGYGVGWDSANGKLKIYYGDLDAVADGPLIEVPDTTNLAAVTFRLLIVSR